MSRYLVVVPPVDERVRPAAALGRELTVRGHEVAWVGSRRVLDGVVPAGATVVPVADRGDGATGVPWLRPVGGVRSPGDLILHWNDFLLPLARLMLPVVQAAVDGFRPDVVVADQQAIAGPVVAHLRRLPWVSIVPTSAGLADPLWDLPDIRRHVKRVRRRFLREVGFDEITAARIDPQTSPHLVVVFSTSALAEGPGERSGRRSGRHVFVGPCLEPPAGAALEDTGAAVAAGFAGFAGDPFDGARPLVVVSLDGARWHRRVPLYRAAAGALSSLPVRAVIAGPPEAAEVAAEVAPVAPVVPVAGPPVTGPPADPHAGPPAGRLAGVRVLPEASLPALVRRATAVVCDGGHRTVCEALAGGVPLVVVPMTGDQPIVADQVARARAGVRVSARSVDAARLRMAVERLLTDTRIRHGAERIRDSFAAAPGPAAAMPRLEALADVPAPKLQ